MSKDSVVLCVSSSDGIFSLYIVLVVRNETIFAKHPRIADINFLPRNLKSPVFRGNKLGFGRVETLDQLEVGPTVLRAKKIRAIPLKYYCGGRDGFGTRTCLHSAKTQQKSVSNQEGPRRCTWTCRCRNLVIFAQDGTYCVLVV